MNILSDFKLPGVLTKEICNNEIKEKDLIFWACSDLDEENCFTEGYVVLFEGSLIVAYLPPVEKAVHLFGGYKNKRAGAIKAETGRYKGNKNNFSIKRFPLEEIDKLDVHMHVSGGELVATNASDGQELRLAVFTKSCISDMKHFVKLFSKVKEEEKLKEEDFKQDDKKDYCPKCGTLYPDKDRKICPKCLDHKSIFLRTLSYFKPYKKKIIIMFICFVGAALINLVWPYLNGTILFDKVLARDEKFFEFINLPEGRFVTLLGAVVLTMLLSSLTMHLLKMIQSVFASKIVPDVVKEIKSQVFSSMGRLSISFYNRKQTGGLMTRVLDDADRVTYFYINILPYFFIHILSIVFISIVMFLMNWILALGTLFLLPLLSIVSIKMLPRLWNYYGRRHRATRSLYGQVNDNITGARVVKAFGQEDSEIERFDIYNSRVRNVERNLVSYDNRYKALYNIVENISTYTVMGLGSILILGSTSMELGVLITFINYVGLLKAPLNFMAEIFRWWSESSNCAQRIYEIIDSLPEVREKSEPIELKEMKGKINLNNVTFGYEANKPVLKNISLQVEAGNMLGIVGRSGAGKSTLVNLISRLYDAEEGEILIDGINVKDLSFDDLHKNIAMVSQETYIFMGTVAQNITYARPEATRTEIIRAAVLASAHDFICKMPDGYDTMIGASGRELSGGERQRISIARTILSDPKILILDEATASVDTETEQAIQSSLAMLVKGRTTLSIAHRLSTLKDADSLIVIDEGKLTEAGTHNELIDKKGTYYKLMQLQTKALALKGIE